MLRRLALLTALLALAAGAPAGAMPSERIVGGTPTAHADLPFMAGLKIAISGVGGDEPDALCGGALIAARWVLTAAHCLAEEPVDVENSYAVIGATNLNTATPDQHFRWQQAIYAPAYDAGTGGSDVGLIRLERPAPGPQLRLLQPGDAGLFTPGTTSYTAGWGYTEDPLDGGTISTNQLRSVDLQIVSDADCAAAFEDAGAPGILEFATEICAIAPNKDSCNGDSGGPLFVDDEGGLPALVGAVSFGIGSGSILRPDRSCNEGPPGVYAKVGSDPLNAYVRQNVPQVELGVQPEEPVPGQRVTLTAQPDHPQGSGPFGGYDGLEWDLDGDGTFGERAGSRTATVTVREPGTSVAVLATSTSGDAEVRRTRIVPVPKSAVSFARASMVVRAGRAVRIRVDRVGTGAGGATVRAGRGATPRRRTLAFTGREAFRTVRLRAARGRARTVTLRLQSFTGDVIAGARTTMRLRVRPR